MVDCPHCKEHGKKVIMKYKKKELGSGKGIRYYYECPKCGYKKM